MSEARVRTTVDHGPARLSSAASMVTAILTVSSSGWYSTDALVVCGAGVVALATSLVLRRRVAAVFGALALVAGVLLSGVHGAPSWTLLVGVAGAIIAWDAAETALSLGRQLDARAHTARLEAVHLIGSLVAGAAAAGAGYVIYRVATGGQPVTALLLLLLAGALLVRAIAE